MSQGSANIERRSPEVKETNLAAAALKVAPYLREITGELAGKDLMTRINAIIEKKMKNEPYEDERNKLMEDMDTIREKLLSNTTPDGRIIIQNYFAEVAKHIA